MGKFHLSNVESPCLNCEHRQTPKLCEKDCLLWKTYQENKKKDKILIDEKKKFERLMSQSLWRGKYKRRNSKWN